MTRKYLNERWCVRCPRGDGPTPYLAEHHPKLFPKNEVGVADLSAGVMDIGCGNGRNTEFLRDIGCTNMVAFDMINDYGYKITLGEDRLPLLDNSVSVILANYVFMFLNGRERKQVIRELKRVAAPGCTIMVELYPAKDSHAPTEQQALAMQQEIFDQFGWTKVLYSKQRFIAKKEV